MMTNTKTRTTATATTTQDTISRTTAYAATGAAGLISLWAGACFVSALVSTGPLGLISNWFSAIAGF
jgi:hypothetical protein